MPFLENHGIVFALHSTRSDELKFSADRLYGKIAQREHPFRFKSVFVANESRRLRI